MTAAALPAVPSSASASRAGGAFWGLLRRVVVFAAGVDVLFFVLFHALGSPLLAWLNVLSVAIYGAAYLLLKRRINQLAIALIWLEVLVHAALGTVLIGWDSGFHYYLLMFIPAIVISSSPRRAAAMVAILLVSYLGLDAAARALGALTPLTPGGVVAVKWFNIVVVFLMFSALGRFYVGMVARAEKRLHELATRDPLTGLFNRRHFQSMSDHAVAHARRAEEGVAIVIADIDLFKHVNDAHGHDAGDKVLVRVSELMHQVFRDQDILARWGGEEFLMLLPDTDADGAAAAAERLRRAAEAATVTHGSKTIRFTVSLGATTLRTDETIADALGRADRALYASKAEGRNRVTRE